MHFDVVQRAFRVAGVGNGVTWYVAGHRFAWQAQGIVRETAGFRGPVREIACVCVSECVRRGKIAAGARNRWIYGFIKRGADVPQNAVAGWRSWRGTSRCAALDVVEAANRGVSIGILIDFNCEVVFQ